MWLALPACRKWVYSTLSSVAFSTPRVIGVFRLNTNKTHSLNMMFTSQIPDTYILHPFGVLEELGFYLKLTEMKTQVELK